MPRTYVTDIQHLLDEQGRPAAGRGGDMARYLGRIIEAGSVIPEGKGQLVPARCANPSHRKRCGGHIGVFRPPTGAISWECIGCHERGVVTNWKGTRYDLSAVAMPRLREERVELAAPLSEFDAVLRRCELGRALRRLLVDASGFDEKYLFVTTDYYQLTPLRDAAQKAADAASGEDRRLLDRFAARADSLATTLMDFFEPDDVDPRELLN